MIKFSVFRLLPLGLLAALGYSMGGSILGVIFPILGVTLFWKMRSSK
jgi:hypothetical protein